MVITSAVTKRKSKFEFIACSIEGCAFQANPKSGGKRGYCPSHYRQMNADGMFQPIEEAMSWIKRHVNFQGSECLIYPFCRTTTGYGQLKIAKKTRGAHRIMCILVNGEPRNRTMHAAHSCGNGHLGCVNPRHLSWKTRSENAQDKVLHNTDSRGEKSVHSKLTDKAVIDIKTSNLPTLQLARKYGVSDAAVWRVLNGKSWRHVQIPERASQIDQRQQAQQ